jgi:hypothetical protein
MLDYSSDQPVELKQIVIDPALFMAKQERRLQQQHRKFKRWSEEWITVARLKSDRLWTSSAIRKYLGEPETQGKYKVFSVDDVKRAEKEAAFREWLQPRIEKCLSTNPHFRLESI